MITQNEDFYRQLRDNLPKGYRVTIAKETGASISLINRVLRGTLRDKKGILISAFTIANNEIKRKNVESDRLIQLKKEYSESISNE